METYVSSSERRRSPIYTYYRRYFWGSFVLLLVWTGLVLLFYLGQEIPDKTLEVFVWIFFSVIALSFLYYTLRLLVFLHMKLGPAEEATPVGVEKKKFFSTYALVYVLKIDGKQHKAVTPAVFSDSLRSVLSVRDYQEKEAVVAYSPLMKKAILLRTKIH